MTVAVMQKLENLRASLEVHINATLVTVDTIKCKFPRVPFDTGGLASWIELNYLNKTTRKIFGRVTSSVGGIDTDRLFQVFCFARIAEATNAYVLERVRDKVLGRLSNGTEISVKDYAGGSPSAVIDTAQVYYESENEIPETVALGGQAAVRIGENLAGLVITYSLRYIEPHAST